MSLTGHHICLNVPSPDTYAQCAAVSGAMSKSVSCRTPAILYALRDHALRTPAIRVLCGLCPAGIPDGDVRQDIDLLIARDTAAQSAQVSRVLDFPVMWCPSGHRFTITLG